MSPGYVNLIIRIEESLLHCVEREDLYKKFFGTGLLRKAR